MTGDSGDQWTVTEPLVAGDERAETGKWKNVDIEEIRSVGQFMREAAAENRRLWALAGPAIFTSVAQYSLGGITQIFAGHLTTLDLDAVSVQNMASPTASCLEFWYLMFLIIMVGLLKNAQIAVAAISICINLHGWEIMIFIGFNAAISVRVSNELGARRPRAAKFSVLIVTLTGGLIGLIFFTTVMALRKVYAIPFTNNPEVVHAVAHLILIFAFTLLSDSIGPVLSGVAVGAGWQALVAYINLGCYYVVGIPLGYLLAFKFDLGLEGMWGGALAGVALQTLILGAITLRTNWEKEATEAESRISKWGGSADSTYNCSKDDGSTSMSAA